MEDVLLIYYRDDINEIESRVLACLAELFWGRWADSTTEAEKLLAERNLLAIKLESLYVRKSPDFLKNQFLLHFISK